jgi:hypothetical protein
LRRALAWDQVDDVAAHRAATRIQRHAGRIDAVANIEGTDTSIPL